MKYIHYEVDASSKDTVEITIDRQANVRLLDDHNFARYKEGKTHTYQGGLVTVSPARLTPPYKGHWHVVVDIGGETGSVNVGVFVRSPS